MKNYEVAVGCTVILGGVPYPAGEVMPEWFANRDGGLAARVKSGHLKEAAKSVTRQYAPPAPKTETDSSPALAQECNRLTAELADAVRSNKDLLGVNAALTAQNEAFLRQLGDQTTRIGLLERMVAERDAKLAEQTTDEVESPVADPNVIPMPTNKRPGKTPQKV